MELLVPLEKSLLLSLMMLLVEPRHMRQ